MAHTCNPSSQEVKAGGFKVQGQPHLHLEFKTSLGYARHCFRKIKSKETKVIIILMPTCINIFFFLEVVARFHKAQIVSNLK